MKKVKANHDERCLFCKIIEQKIPSTKVYEDEVVYGFKDIQPQAPIHYLFIPKNHFEGLGALSSDEFSVMADLYRAVALAVKNEGLEKLGYRTVINTGKHGGQTVFHLHVHLIAGRQLGGNMAGA